MSAQQDLVDAIESVIQDAAGLGYNQPSAANDIYENYVWSLCLEAAKRQGGTISYETVYGNPATNLIFRTAPGAIYGDTYEYTHAVISFPNCPALEAHVGIRVTGKSRVLHECDVAVVFRDECVLCRKEQVHPRASQVLIASECKFYASSVQLYLGRGFLGLTTDISRKLRYFVTNADSSSITKLLSHHEAEWECGVVPQSTEADDLLHSLSRGFKNFKAKYV